MLKRIICILVLVFTSSIFGQNVVKHTVATGETIQAIAQKYRVTPYDIYKLNPDSQSGIKLNSILLIPVSSDVSPSKSVNNVKSTTSIGKVHEVLVGETMYSISKKYEIAITDLENLNPFLKTDGLQPGQKLQLSSKVPTSQSTVKAGLIHEVQPKETKYGIASKYGMTVEELEKMNPEIVENLPIGFQLKIKNGSSNDQKVVNGAQKTSPVPTVNKMNVLEYMVKPGETMYSLTRQFGISETALKNLNPELNEGVKEGMFLKVPSNTSFLKEGKNNQKDLSVSLSKQERKKLVLFLPFNATKIQNDTVISVSERLKKDKFLNMTLDFYSGALMAIDSAKVLGISMHVQIFDSKESKFSTSALNVISKEDFSAIDAVIGPFYQINVEKVASALESKGIPVISPLSKDEGKSFANLYQSMPNSETIKKAMFDYMKSKNGNIIAVIDHKKNSIKDYILNFQNETKIVGLTSKLGIVADSIRKHFVKDRMNFVIMASENTNSIFTITTTLLGALKDFPIQLVILEENQTLDFEEIALSRLTKLKMAYPSIINDTESEGRLRFARAYKKKNKINPNQFALRGFDLTFDTIFRLAQDKPFSETNGIVTEQVESKFDYNQKLSGGFANNGVYILNYENDLTIKQAQ